MIVEDGVLVKVEEDDVEWGKLNIPENVKIIEGVAFGDLDNVVDIKIPDGGIQMLDLEIIPNMPELIQENRKIEEFLRKTQEVIKMHGKEKEVGLDELRKQIRKEKGHSDDR